MRTEHTMSKISINEINHAIMYGDFTDDQLNSIWMAVKYAKSQMGRANLYTVKVGDQVKFNNKGRIVTGSLFSKGRKYVKVLEGRTTWRVPANMIEAA
jgi:hypothetical protein